MDIKRIIETEEIKNSPQLLEVYKQWDELISELNTLQLTDSTISHINDQIDTINNSTASGKKLRALMLRKQTDASRLLEKEHKLVTKNYYRNLWGALGLSAIGLPIGVALGLSGGNMGLLALGIPIGFALGLAIGKSMDKKAEEEGRRLKTDLKIKM